MSLPLGPGGWVAGPGASRSGPGGWRVTPGESTRRPGGFASSPLVQMRRTPRSGCTKPERREGPVGAADLRVRPSA